MMLRLQTERMQGNYVPSIREYFRFFGLDYEKLGAAKPDALVMHPGPMNRGVEIDSEVADDIGRSAIREQVEMGVAVRMAVPRDPGAQPAGPGREQRLMAAPTRKDGGAARRLHQRAPARSGERPRRAGRAADRGRRHRRSRPAPVRRGRARGHRDGRLRAATAWRPAWSTCASSCASRARSTRRRSGPRARAAAAGGVTSHGLPAQHRSGDRRRRRRSSSSRGARARCAAPRSTATPRSTRGLGGSELTEMGLLSETGALGFTDGTKADRQRARHAPRAALRAHLRRADRAASRGAGLDPGRRHERRRGRAAPRPVRHSRRSPRS